MKMEFLNGLLSLQITKSKPVVSRNFNESHSEVATIDPEIFKMNNTEIVEKIHNEFLSTGENLLQEANKYLSETKIENENKAKKLSQFGFDSTDNAKSYNSIKYKKDEHSKMMEVITHWKNKYPMHKFIPKTHVIKICEKYGLILAGVSRYKGFVPENNVKEISEFFEKYTSDTVRYIKYTDRRRMEISIDTWYDTREELIEAFEKMIQDNSDNKNTGFKDVNVENGIFNGYVHYTHFEEDKNVLSICAPLKDMVIHESEQIKNSQIVTYPDPIVLLQKPPYRGVEGYIIITAWGDEASDELVVNQNNN